MALIFVTGIAGSGKTAIRKELTTRGFEAYDTDKDGMTSWVNKDSGEVVNTPSEEWSQRTAEWYSRHDWNTSTDKVRQLALDARSRPIFLCGTSSNRMEVIKYCSIVIGLHVDEDVLRHRIATRKNPFGKQQHELENILKWHLESEVADRNAGAIMVDANKPLPEVVAEILKIAAELPIESPAKWVVRLPEYVESGSVLDMGAGSGRNAMFMATHGFSVTAVDPERDNIEAMTRVAADNSLQLAILWNNILDYEPNRTFDVVICWHVLHFLRSANEAEQAARRIQKMTAVGGLNAVAVLLQKDANNPRPHLFADNELRNLYNDGWEIIDYSEELSDAYRPEPLADSMQSWVARLIARKI